MWKTEASFKGVNSMFSMFIPRVIHFLSKSQMLYLNLYCCEQWETFIILNWTKHTKLFRPIMMSILIDDIVHKMTILTSILFMIICICLVIQVNRYWYDIVDIDTKVRQSQDGTIFMRSNASINVVFHSDEMISI